ncbi:hypothetical protein N7495_005851 [Penicillium taxi]|uniref:uncharacterized protein n=1 Tax=Penicillium taxi TaxID=168475 RepID=UPI0025458DCF|nr:uncharacterized protein N7495_005851 [Penicillium taxi]KAJ5894160.1 hypothetical protein N7495_005851 [Penicillium taxi]
MQAFVPKNRRPRFELVLRITDINNVPLGNSVVWVKWRLPSSSATEHQGHTEKVHLADHRAYWNYEKALSVRLTIDKNSVLQECDINFEVIQEFHSSPTLEKNVLGKIKLNLAEYVDKVEEDEGVVRRYLMFDSKVNSTLKIGITLRQTEGDRNFTTPTLKSPTVFGGIARVVHAAEPGDPEDLGNLPSINSKTKELADMQDMYRRTLAASWISRAGDLPADKMVEELFAGSSYWNNEIHAVMQNPTEEPSQFLEMVEAIERQSRTMKGLSPNFEKRPRSSSSHKGGKKPGFLATAIEHHRQGSSIEQKLYDGNSKTWKNRSPADEISEFDVREDLRSWEISAKK